MFIESELMVLWAKDDYQRMHWTQAFVSIMKDKQQPEKVDIVETKKNKFVLSCYNKLKEKLHNEV